MGNRIKGKVKKKSIRAAMHSGMGTKRKLTRMGKKRKKDHAGLDATFIGRSKCLMKLQISLKDFRRLCILKGVYPRQPRSGAPRNKKGQVYYHIKDIKAIAHEPVLDKFREFKSFMKRVRKAAGRNEKDEAARLDAMAPQFTLHHLVRERYPRFADAVGDLDDALALTYLFAALPSAGRIKTSVTDKAQRLAAAWSAYCAVSSSITKTFISVKGVYFEADVHNTPVRWIVPHSFTQHLPNDVDYRVMLTFFEFYEVLLGFVLYKLYSDIGVRYPLHLPKLTERSASSLMTAHLQTLVRQLKGGDSTVISSAVTDRVAKEKNNNDEDDAEDMDASNSTEKMKKAKQLLKTVDVALQKVHDDDDEDDDENSDDENMDIATPLKAALDNLAEEQNQQVNSNTDTTDSNNDNNTLSDDAMKRKRLFSNLTFFLSREVPRGYLELICLSYGAKVVGWENDSQSPISVNDASITHHIVDRPVLPANLQDQHSNTREYIQPQWILDCANHDVLLPCSRYAVGEELPPHLSPWVDNEEEGYTPQYAEEIARFKNGESMPLEEEEEDAASIEDEVDEKEKESESEDEEEEDSEEVVVEKQSKKRKAEEDETHALAKLLMSKKASRLYGKMQHGISQKQAKIEHLQRRRQEIETEKKKNKAGQTPLKQKVVRLKDERRAVEKDYEKNNKENTGTKKKKRKRNNKKRVDAEDGSSAITTTKE